MTDVYECGGGEVESRREGGSRGFIYVSGRAAAARDWLEVMGMGVSRRHAASGEGGYEVVMEHGGMWRT